MADYASIKAQNELLKNAITESQTQNNTYNQKSVYQLGDIVFLTTINNILFYIYYFILFIVAYYVFIDKEYGKYKKALILFLFAGYPYLVNLLKYYLVIIGSYIYSILNVNVYENGQW